MYGIIEHGMTRGFIATMRSEAREIVKHGTGGPAIVTVGGFVKASRHHSIRACKIDLIRGGADRVIDETNGTARVVYGPK